MMGKRCQIKLFVVLDEKKGVLPRNGIISEGEILTNHLANIKGDSMNLTVTSEVLGPLTLGFQLLLRNLPKNRDFNHSFDV